ncbi:hypothetical protein K438DRAFT_1852988 [Mycena galopus ATCC 62051]|nr:hypothetical protein K438DRAFT_1852988 [Mycena galopus ATCC 62051]
MHSDVFAKDAIDAYYRRYPNAPRRIASAAFDSLSSGNRPSVRPSVHPPGSAHRTAPLPRPILRPAPSDRPASPDCPAFGPAPQPAPHGTSPPASPDSVPLRPPTSGRSHWHVLCDQARDYCQSLRTCATG